MTRPAPLSQTILLPLSLCAGCAATMPSPLAASPDTSPAERPARCSTDSAGLSVPPLDREPAAAVIARLGTGLPRYDRTDAEWLPHAPVAVNEDFDFATAMSLDTIGAGLAAAKRKRDNRAKAEALASVSLSRETRASLDRLRRCGTHLYALLWGPTEASTLRLVIDRFAADGSRSDYTVLEQGTRGIEGPGGWKANASAIDRAFVAAAREAERRQRSQNASRRTSERPSDRANPEARPESSARALDRRAARP